MLATGETGASSRRSWASRVPVCCGSWINWGCEGYRPRMSIERDLLARMQQKLTATLAQVRPFLERRQFPAASRLLGDSYYALFGLHRRFLQMMKPPQFVTVLDSLEKVRAYAALLAQDAE